MKQYTVMALVLLFLGAQAQTNMGAVLSSGHNFQNFVQPTATDLPFTGIGTKQWYNFMVAFQAKDVLCQPTPAAATTITQATFDQTAEDRMYMDCLNTARQCTGFLDANSMGTTFVANKPGIFNDIVINVQACYDYCHPLAAAASAGVKKYDECYLAGLGAANPIENSIYKQINPTTAEAWYAATDSSVGFNANGARIAQCVGATGAWDMYSEFYQDRQGPFWKTLYKGKLDKITAECTDKKELGPADKPNAALIKCLRGALKYGYEQDMGVYRGLLSCVQPPNFTNRGNGKIGKSDGESELSQLDGELINARVKLFADLGTCLDAQFQITWEQKAFVDRVDENGAAFPQFVNYKAQGGDNGRAQFFNRDLGKLELQKWSKGVRNCLAFDNNCQELRNHFQTRNHLMSSETGGDKKVLKSAKECAESCINQHLWETNGVTANVWTNADKYFRGHIPAVQSDLEKGKACFATFTKGVTLNGRSLFSSNGSILVLGTIVTLVLALVF